MKDKNTNVQKILRILLAFIIACAAGFFVYPLLNDNGSETEDISMTYSAVILNTYEDFKNELENKTMRDDFSTFSNYYEYFGDFKVYIPETWSNADPYFRPDKFSQLYCFEKNFIARTGFFTKAEEIFCRELENRGITDADIRNEYHYILNGLYVNRFVFTAGEGEEKQMMTCDLVRRPNGKGLIGFLYSESISSESSSLQDYNNILQEIELR